MMDKSDNEEAVTVEPESVENITPHNKALYEAGKALLVQSVKVGREFCRFMATVALGAVPSYIALLKLVLPKDYSLEARDEVVFLAPPFLFLLSAIVFAVGYFPRKGKLSLDLPEEIEQERTETIRRRNCYAVTGFIILCIGIAFSSCLLVLRLGS